MKMIEMLKSGIQWGFQHWCCSEPVLRRLVSDGIQIVVWYGVQYRLFIMTERRVLPARSTRGKRPEISEQQMLKEDALYNQIFEAAQNPVTGQSRERPPKRTDDGEHRQYSMGNKVNFPYSRGYHYFFDLSTFPRVEGTVSYAFDHNNAFHSTFSSEDRIIKDEITVGELLNRAIIGLPTAEAVHVPKTKDKNICHRYLFQNEDRKYEIDRVLYELKQILEYFEKLENTGMIKAFGSLRKDVDLAPVLQETTSTQDKKDALARKIKLLEERKKSMRNSFFNEDKNFYYHSLNQKLHDDIEELSFSLGTEFILAEISFAESKRQQLEGLHPLEASALAKLFLYAQTEKACLKLSTIQAISQKVLPSFFSKSPTEDVYEISLPFMFLDFHNHHIMTISEKVMAHKLAHQSEASFFICKLFWKRVFGRDLTFNKEMKPMVKCDYDKAMMQTVNQLHKWKAARGRETERNNQGCPELDDLLSWDALEPHSQITVLFPRDQEVEITAREFILLVLFSRLYFCISDIYEFVLTNDNLIMLIAYDYYSKAHNYLVEGVGTPRFGILDEVLQKLSESVISNEIDVQFKLKWVYNQKHGVAYIIKAEVASEWETEKEDNSNQHQNDHEVEDVVEKKIKTT